MIRNLIVFIIIFLNSTAISALNIEERKFDGKKYQLIKDWNNETITYEKKFNSLVRNISNSYIFLESYSLLNINIKYFYEFELKTKPKLYLDSIEWKDFTFEVSKNDKSKKDYDYKILIKASEFDNFKSSQKLDIRFDNFEIALNISKLPLDKISILDKNKNKKNISKKTTTIIDEKKVNKTTNNKNNKSSEDKKKIVSKNNSSKIEKLSNLNGGKNKQIEALKQIEGVNDASWPQDISLWIVMENPNAGHDFKKLGSMVCNGSVTNFGVQKGYTITFWNLYTKKQIEKYRCY